MVSKLKSIKRDATFSIKNSVEVIKDLTNLEIGENNEMVSFDVKALFPSIPEIEAVALMKQWLVESEISNRDAELYSGLIDLVVSQKVFQFNNKLYQQESGASIGSLLSPWEAEVFMNDLEGRMMEKPGKPRFFRRYVDDVIAIVEK